MNRKNVVDPFKSEAPWWLPSAESVMLVCSALANLAVMLQIMPREFTLEAFHLMLVLMGINIVIGLTMAFNSPRLAPAILQGNLVAQMSYWFFIAALNHALAGVLR